MNFRKISKGGGGSFSFQQFMLQIFAIIADTSVLNFRKNLQLNFFENDGGGGSKAIWNFSKNSSVLEGVGVPYTRMASLIKVIIIVVVVIAIFTIFIVGIEYFAYCNQD